MSPVRSDSSHRSTPITLTLGHSPDPDDAFMWWPLGDVDNDIPPTIDTGPFRFRPVAADIEVLNRRAIDAADLDVTACSMHTYPYVHHDYALTSCGASMGLGYGPRVVALPQTIAARARHALKLDVPQDSLADSIVESVSWLADPEVTIAVPGERTTAFLVLRLMLGRPFRYVAMPFERIVAAVVAGDVDAGLVIHEAQITFDDAGLGSVVDLGAWWQAATSLPLPLGANAIKRDLDRRFGEQTSRNLTTVLKRSIEHALASMDHAVTHALAFAQPGTSRANAERFIGMYVNDLTIDAGARGEVAIRELLTRAFRAGLAPDPGDVDLVLPAGA